MTEETGNYKRKYEQVEQELVAVRSDLEKQTAEAENFKRRYERKDKEFDNYLDAEGRELIKVWDQIHEANIQNEALQAKVAKLTEEGREHAAVRHALEMKTAEANKFKRLFGKLAEESAGATETLSERDKQISNLENDAAVLHYEIVIRDEKIDELNQTVTVLVESGEGVADERAHPNGESAHASALKSAIDSLLYRPDDDFAL